MTPSRRRPREPDTLSSDAGQPMVVEWTADKKITVNFETDKEENKIELPALH